MNGCHSSDIYIFSSFLDMVSPVPRRASDIDGVGLLVFWWSKV